MQTIRQFGAQGLHRVVYAFASVLALIIFSYIFPYDVHAEDAPTISADEQRVERLQDILRAYYTESEPQLPTSTASDPNEVSEPVDTGAGASDEKQTSAQAPATFSADQVYLNGSEATALLKKFTRRLQDPRIPDLHRDVAPICSVKTRLFDTLVASERLSLKPIGKHHYIGSLKLQPGISTFSIKSQQWDADILADGKAREHLITFYRYPGQKTQLHTFAIEELIASGVTEAPAWLPPDIAELFTP